MSEAVSTPAAPVSTSSAPAASATPASASAGASAPVTTPAAAPAVTTDAAPASSPTTSPADAGKTTFQLMQEATAAKLAAEESGAAVPAAEDPAKVVDPADPAPEKTAEEIAAEAEAARVAEETAAAEAAKGDKPGDGDEDDIPNFDDFELDPIALAPKELAGKIETDPALAAALEGNPELKNQIFANARLAAETAQFKEVFGSPAEAKVAAEGHAKFAAIASAMMGIQDADSETVRPVMQQMLEASALRGPNGELQYDKDGALVTDGSVGRFVRNSFKQRMEIFASQFEKDGDDEGQAAVDILMERAGLRPSSASGSEEEMSAEVRSQYEAVKAERAQLNAEKEARAAEVAEAHNTAVNTRIDSMMDAGIGSLLARATGLNDFSRTTVEKNIRAALKKEIAGNPQFQTEMDRLDRMPYGKDRQKAHMALATRYFQTGLAKVAAAKLAEAGASITAKQQAQAEISAARTEAARSEVRGATASVKTAPVLNEKESFAQIEADLRKTLGRSPTNLELMSENLKRKSVTAAA